jgi:phospholipid/cholesterol/gamma-HCH transport system substrate-binding protein
VSKPGHIGRELPFSQSLRDGGKKVAKFQILIPMGLQREVKVGAFVLAGLFVVGAVIFLIGDQRQLFTSKEDYKAVFSDVNGLTRGSPVRMGGIDVGAVSKIAYSDDASDPKLYVTFSVVENEARRIRGDSVARIEAKGLLGDKMVVITIGSPQKDRIDPGGTIPTEEAKDMTAMLAKLGDIGTKAERVVENLEKTTGALSDEKFTRDLKSSVSSLSGILQSLDQGEGYAGRLIRDPAEADKMSRTMANLERASVELSRSAQNVNQVLDRVRTGPGFAHDVIYTDGPSKTLTQFGQAAEEVSTTLRGVREGNGIARSVIYGDDQSQQVMKNLNEMSVDLRRIVADVRAGKGTVGALLVDPSIYEDIKMVLGNVERNKTLRALVRYSITRDEKSRGVVVKDPTPAPAVRAVGEAERATDNAASKNP